MFGFLFCAHFIFVYVDVWVCAHVCRYPAMILLRFCVSGGGIFFKAFSGITEGIPTSVSLVTVDCMCLSQVYIFCIILKILLKLCSSLDSV